MDVWDRVWDKVKVATGKCSGSLDFEDVANILKKGEDYARYAAAANLLVGQPGAYDKLIKGANALAEVRKPVDKTLAICADLRAILKMQQAIKVLNDPANMKPGSEAAARAFGDLFVAAGHFADYLPGPAKAYALILKSCGSFFVDMQILFDPERRPISGPRLRQIMRDL